MKKKVKQTVTKVPQGTIRIRAKTITPVKKTTQGWVPVKDFDTTMIKKIVQQYKAHKNFTELVSKNNTQFLKGEVTSKGLIRGERITRLPNGEALAGRFSLFSPHLTIHDEKTNDHWDVLYQNPNGSFAHLYTTTKIQQKKKQKYKAVHDFKKRLPILEQRLKKAIVQGELIALPLYTLLKTYMRIGNLNSYKTHGHKGLTTLNKQDIIINDTTNTVTFDYIGKDGVPQTTTKTFPRIYMTNLKNELHHKKDTDFAFHNEYGNVLRDTQFEDAFETYTGRRFYPHIVRSYYATTAVENFLKQNKNPTKQEIQELYDTIAQALGHKKFSKKDNAWKPSHTITVSHYIDPALVKRINRIITKR